MEKSPTKKKKKKKSRCPTPTLLGEFKELHRQSSKIFGTRVLAFSSSKYVLAFSSSKYESTVSALALCTRNLTPATMRGIEEGEGRVVVKWRDGGGRGRGRGAGNDCH